MRLPANADLIYHCPAISDQKDRNPESASMQPLKQPENPDSIEACTTRQNWGAYSTDEHAI
jgi:hypothetical protein